MRIKSVLAVGAVFAALAAAPATAFDAYHRAPPGVDPYAYQYTPRGYYPYYASRYWVPAHIVHRRKYLHYYQWNTQPPRYRYYPAWGYPSRTWKHREWHARNHGHIRRWHW